jgi:hypothetical protein
MFGGRRIPNSVVINIVEWNVSRSLEYMSQLFRPITLPFDSLLLFVSRNLLLQPQNCIIRPEMYVIQSRKTYTGTLEPNIKIHTWQHTNINIVHR